MSLAYSDTPSGHRITFPRRDIRKFYFQSVLKNVSHTPESCLPFMKKVRQWNFHKSRQDFRVTLMRRAPQCSRPPWANGRF